ncbi:MAG: hypothetical protein QMD12_03515 [Candidatus Aenigmarchaeota archaeon]|nr:hypothetical protein [Candidatus Aenigmarchaeota archaeon]
MKFPFALVFGGKNLVLDDLDKYAEKQNFFHLLQEFLKQEILIVASCRSGPEYNRLLKYMDKFNFGISQVFDAPIEIQKIEIEEGEKIAEQIGTELSSTFDGNIGSIFIPLDTMKVRYRDCTGVEKGILRSIRRLYYAGIYGSREIFFLERIKYVCKEMEGIEKKDYEWNELFNSLKNNGFIEIKDDEIWAEEAYLEFVIEDDLSVLDILNKMMDIFSKDADVLFSLGNKACHIELDNKAEYVKIAIKAYEEALKVYTPDRFPRDYAKTKDRLGDVYLTLKRYSDALACYKSVLEIEPRNKSALKGAGISCSKMERHKEVLGFLLRAIEEDKEDYFSWKAAGIEYVELKKYKEALNCYQRAFELESNAENAFLVGYAHLKRYNDLWDFLNQVHNRGIWSEELAGLGMAIISTPEGEEATWQRVIERTEREKLEAREVKEEEYNFLSRYKWSLKEDDYTHLAEWQAERGRVIPAIFRIIREEKEERIKKGKDTWYARVECHKLIEALEYITQKDPSSTKLYLNSAFDMFEILDDFLLSLTKRDPSLVLE